MEIIVTKCNDCPFCVRDVNNDCVGNDILLICQLSIFNNKDHIITNFDSISNEDCDYCQEWMEKSNQLWEHQQIIYPWIQDKCSCEEIHENKQNTFIKPKWCPLTENLTIKPI